jgi:hypothetical protein
MHYEEAEADYHALLNEGRAERKEEDRVAREGARRVKVGDTLYWHDMDDGKCSGFYKITSMRSEEFISVTGQPEEEMLFTLEGNGEEREIMQCRLITLRSLRDGFRSRMIVTEAIRWKR